MPKQNKWICIPVRVSIYIHLMSCKEHLNTMPNTLGFIFNFSHREVLELLLCKVGLMKCDTNLAHLIPMLGKNFKEWLDTQNIDSLTEKATKSTIGKETKYKNITVTREIHRKLSNFATYLTGKHFVKIDMSYVILILLSMAGYYSMFMLYTCSPQEVGHFLLWEDKQIN